MGGPCSMRCLVLPLVFALCCWLAHSTLPPPYEFEMGTFDPQGPNATCMTQAEVAAKWPEHWEPCADVLAGQYNSIYVDANQARRNQLGELLVVYSQPSSKQCQSSSLVLACLAQWRRCSTVTVPTSGGNETLIVATPVCRQYCDAWSIDCLFTYDVTPAYILFNCTTPTPNLWDNYTVPYMFPQKIDPIVPVASVIDPLQTFNVSIPCFVTTNLSAVTPAQLCPSPLLPDYTTGYCSLGCPLPVISDDEYKGLEVMMSVFGWISFVLTGFLIATYIIDPTKRVYPAILPLFFIFCINATSFAFCLGSMVGHEDVWCKDDATPYDFGGGACTVQGIIWVYFTMAGVFWWTIIAINLMLMLVSTKFKDFMKRWYHLYHFIWLLPIITLIISLANEKLGYGGDVWCSVHIGPSSVSYSQTSEGVQTNEDDTAYLWNLLLIIVPIFCLVFVGMVCLTVVLVYMGINYKNLGWSYLATQWRLFVFLMFYIYIYVFVFAFQIELIVQKDDQYTAYGDYINCLLLHLFNFNLNCELDQYVNYPLWVIVVFNASAQGIFVFIIFGTTLQVYKAWLHLFRLDRLLGMSTQTSTGSSTTRIQGKIVSSKSGASMSANSEMMQSLEEEDDGSRSSSSNSSDEKSEAKSAKSEKASDNEKDSDKEKSGEESN